MGVVATKLGSSFSHCFSLVLVHSIKALETNGTKTIFLRPLPTLKPNCFLSWFIRILTLLALKSTTLPKRGRLDRVSGTSPTIATTIVKSQLWLQLYSQLHVHKIRRSVFEWDSQVYTMHTYIHHVYILTSRRNAKFTPGEFHLSVCENPEKASSQAGPSKRLCMQFVQWNIFSRNIDNYAVI
jgi:hypothetical protein